MPVSVPRILMRLIEMRRCTILEDQEDRTWSTARRSRARASYQGDDRPAERGPLAACPHEPLECTDGTRTLASDEDTPRTALPGMEQEPIPVRAGGACPEDRSDRHPSLARPLKHAVAASHARCQVQRREHRLIFQAKTDLQIGTLLPNAADQIAIDIFAGGLAET